MLLVIETKVVIEVPEGTDPEDLATAFNAGYEQCLRPFEAHAGVDIAGTDVTGVRPATDEEKHEYSE